MYMSQSHSEVYKVAVCGGGGGNKSGPWGKKVGSCVRCDSVELKVYTLLLSRLPAHQLIISGLTDLRLDVIILNGTEAETCFNFR